MALSACAEDRLPVTDHLIYWLDFSDTSTITTNPVTRETLTLADKSGNGFNFVAATGFNNGGVAGPLRGPIYVAAGDTNQPSGLGSCPAPASGLGYANFIRPPTSQGNTGYIMEMDQATGGATTPQTVFIVHNTMDANSMGGIWGRSRRLTGTGEMGIRLWSDDTACGPYPPIPHHLWVYWDSATRDFIGARNLYQYNGGTTCYWQDSTLKDQAQAWFSKNWGVTVASRPGGTTMSFASLGNYNNENDVPNYQREWSGGMGEVIVYDATLSDADRQSVELYLSEKWLYPHLPLIDNVPGYEVTPDGAGARLRGMLTWPGRPAPAEVWIYWGLSDGGTNAIDWAHTNYFGTNAATCPVPYSLPIGSLPSDTLYYYRYAAANIVGTNWATTSASFVTGHGATIIIK